MSFLAALAPSEQSCRERGRQYKTLADWAHQLALQARRWLPGREVVLVGAAASPHSTARTVTTRPTPSDGAA